jgi:hypothetical protein
MNDPMRYEGDDFCITHGYEHMVRAMGNPVPWCEACEEERIRCLTDEAKVSDMTKDRTT